MRKSGFFKSLMAIFLLFSVFTCTGVMSAQAAVVEQQTGFVEYQTEASVNFNEIIEVVLTDKKTGYYYTHELYRVNDYAGNPSVPFGTYSVSAQVLSDPDAMQYSVTCLSDEVVVNNGSLAVPIRLKVDIATGIDTELSSVESSEIKIQESSSSENENSNNGVIENKHKYYLWFSVLFFLGIALLAVVVYLIIRWKSNK